MPKERRFEVKALTRVEGEGALRVTVRNNAVEHVELNIFEPPRFFEVFCAVARFTRCRTSPPASAEFVPWRTR